MTALIDALDARRGIVCAVGAGGKKSVLYQLMREHLRARGADRHRAHDRIPRRSRASGRSSTRTRTCRRGYWPSQAAVPIAYACPSNKPGRHAGAAPATIRAIHDAAGFDATLVKADGARMRWIKAPAADEPMLVPGVDIVIPVLSARAIGEPLSERVAHRVDRVAAVTDVAPGEILTPEAVGRLLASEQGSLHCTAGARVAPVINMVDNDDKEELARAAAGAAIAMTSRFDRVVLCCLRRPEQPVVAVVTG